MACLLFGGHVMMLAPPSQGRRGGLFPTCRVHLARRGVSFLAIRASKAGQPEGQGPPPYSDVLLQREYELWQRQSGLYEQLLQQHERERGHWEAERERWAAQEASLKQEVAELRAQLLYMLSRTGGAVPDARSSSSSTASSPFVPQQQEPAPLPGRQQRQLPLGAAGLSPGEQVQAVINAVKSGAAAAGADGASWPAEGGEAGGKVGRELPRYAAELAAAVAAVEELDVLSEEIDFGALADRLTQRGLAPGEAQAPAPAPAAAAAAAAPALPPAQASSRAALSAAPHAAAPPAEPAEQQQDTGSPAVDPGPRPALVSGSDDIYWMNELHRALVGAGYYPGDDDVEDFFFGESTLSAVLTLQACEGLPETGVVDEATWEKLLAAAGEELESSQGQPQASSAAMQASAAGPAVSPKPYQELFAQAVTSERSESPGGAVRAVHELTITDSVQSTPGGGIQETVTVHEETVVVSNPSAALTAWPVLMEGDGGKAVHALHVALEQNGCYPSDDDIRWWQFGDSTLAALKTFQACSGLPESGVADPATWRKLLGPDATPADLANLRSGDSADEDMAQEGRVWLMGEQRWEDPKRVKRH